MQIKEELKKEAVGIRFVAEENSRAVGRVFLYILYNALHSEPFGLVEDVFVEAEFRGQGIGAKLMAAAIAKAKEEGCYKMIFTTRHAKTEVKEWYQKLGFSDWGTEFRMDLK